MSIIKSDDKTKYLIIKIIITTYVSIITLDLIAHWKTKKRQDIKLLILGASAIGILTNLLVSESIHSFLLISKIIIILTSTGLLATREDIDNEGKAPEELYVTLYSSIFIVFIAILWWYFGDKIKTNILKKNSLKKSYMDGEY